MSDDIKQAIYDHMMREHIGSSKLYPSSLGGCIRQAMYKNKGFKETHPMPNWKRWQLDRYGWYETPIVKALGGYDQFPLENSRWKGRADLFVNTTLFEVKSFGSSTRVMDLPRANHKLQMWCYCILALEQGDSIDKAYIVYIERWADKHRKVPRIYVYDVTPSDENMDLAKVRTLMAEMEEWQDKDKLPHRPYNNPQEHKWNCMKQTYNFPYKRTEWEIQCPFFAHCWPSYTDKHNEPIVEILPF